MAQPTEYPLLRLGAPTAIARKKGNSPPPGRKLSPGEQAQTAGGQRLQHLADQLAAETPTLEIRSDPSALAPERLLVFELTGSVLAFEKAASLVPGLEFLGAEDLDDDELDRNPALYLMVPNEGALRNIVTLWRGWQANGTVPSGFSAWKALLTQLRDVRPWGPQDRITPEDREVLRSEYQFATGPVRVEIELVFRQNGDWTETAASQAVVLRGGTVISRTRIAGAGYHALLCDIPPAALNAAINLDPAGLTGVETVLQIRPQSVLQLVPVEEVASGPLIPIAPLGGDPIAAIFDAVPLSAHPRLAGRLSVE